MFAFKSFVSSIIIHFVQFVNKNIIFFVFFSLTTTFLADILNILINILSHV